ncbi:MAG: hypothetical protein IJN67_11690 [Oscillospiraceae bacterium]|nr:hypothetical protein [Oscillospiraceae bacterium]
MDLLTLALAKAETAKLENTILEDKEVTITWDGDITGKDMVWAGENWGWCRVSDRTPSAEELRNATVKSLGGETVGFEDIANSRFDQYCDDDISYLTLFFAAYSDNAIVPFYDKPVPKTGLYFVFKLLNEPTGTIVEMTYPTTILKKDRIPNTVVFDLDAMGIDIQSLVVAGGGSASVDASEIWKEVTKGGTYIFRGSFNGDTVDINPTFIVWNPNGTLDTIGLSLAAMVSGSFIQAHCMLDKDYIYCTVTPLGA